MRTENSGAEREGERGDLVLDEVTATKTDLVSVGVLLVAIELEGNTKQER